MNIEELLKDRSGKKLIKDRSGKKLTRKQKFEMEKDFLIYKHVSEIKKLFDKYYPIEKPQQNDETNTT